MQATISSSGSRRQKDTRADSTLKPSRPGSGLVLKHLPHTQESRRSRRLQTATSRKRPGDAAAAAPRGFGTRPWPRSLACEPVDPAALGKQRAGTGSDLLHGSRFHRAATRPSSDGESPFLGHRCSGSRKGDAGR